MWIVLGAGGCNKKPTDPVFPKDNQFPPQPRDLAVSVDDQQATLIWEIDSPAAVRFYRIYRRDTTTTTFAVIDTSLDRIHLDKTVKNETKYFYQVSAVNAGGFESRRSSSIMATPFSLASLIIATGADYTSQRQVQLKLTAPSRTALMKLSNDVFFTNASWQRFESTVSWILSFGDGVKTVYVKFRDADGRENPQVVKDSIILDTTALITELREDTGGQIKKAGDAIHFRLVAGEIGGRATVNIFSGPQNILLFDDGTQGDQVANNGVYEVNFVIPQDTQVLQGKVRGNFVDRVGNMATTVSAATQITIQKPPDAVTLFQPVPVGSQQNALRLTWSVSKDTFDFANYSIYRSTTSNFDPFRLTPVDRITLREVTTYTDLSLQAGVTYYYRLVIFDLAGLTSASSNEVGARTTANLPPTPVTLALPAAPDTAALSLSWSQNNDPDFASYRVFRAKAGDPPIDPARQQPIAIINSNPASTSYLDRGLGRNKTFTYQVYVYDNGGLASPSNPVLGTTR